MALDKLKETALEPYTAQITKTIRPCVFIKTTLATKELPVWQSKFGGRPYLPKGEQYPQAKDGRPLLLLAQLNFAEIPHIKNYPEKGILQFFIDGNSPDWLYGLDFDNPFNQDNFRVRFYDDVQPDLAKLVTKFDFPAEFSASPIGSHEFSLKFVKQNMPITDIDYTFEQFSLMLQKLGAPDNIDEIYYEFMISNWPGPWHQISGYPYFTQSDPRPYNDAKDIELLFQMDTDENGIMWGDAGVGNFFIHPDNLKKKDFSRIFYTWDCC